MNLTLGVIIVNLYGKGIKTQGVKLAPDNKEVHLTMTGKTVCAYDNCADRNVFQLVFATVSTDLINSLYALWQAAQGYGQTISYLDANGVTWLVRWIDDHFPFTIGTPVIGGGTITLECV